MGTLNIMTKPREEKENLKVPQSKIVYLVGQRISNYFESMITGYTPLILNIFNVFIALMTAAFVAWLLPSMPHAFWKISALTLAGSLVAIYFPSRLSFTIQCSKHYHRVKKNDKLDGEYKKRVMSKINGEFYKNISLSILGIIIVVGVHLTMVTLMLVAFTDSTLVNTLDIKGGEFAYIAIGLGIEIVSMLIDIFLGFVTRVRVDVRNFFPDFDEDQEILERSEEYNKLKSRGKSSGTGSPKGGSSGGGGGSNKGGNTNKSKFDPNKPLEDLSKIKEQNAFLDKVFEGTGFNAKNLFNKLNSSSTKDFQDAGSEIAKSVRILRNLYKSGSNPKVWKSKGKSIHTKIEGIKEGLEKEFNKVGYKLKK